MKKTQYQINAEKFLADTNSTLQVFYTGTRPYFPDDKESRDVYSVTLTRGSKSFTFSFGDSIKNTEHQKYSEFGKWHRPNAYDVLACITKYEPESNIDEFIAAYGYDKASVALKVYEAVKEEYAGITSLYNADEMALLAEIN